MKKVILSITLIAGIFATASIQATNSTFDQPIIEATFDDDGFVNVKFDDLNEKVQEAVRSLTQEYDFNALKYNAEKQLTKVETTKKEDQSQKTFYFDIEGKEVFLEESKKDSVTEETVQQGESPSAEISYAISQNDDGFIEVKLEDLNEKVQAAINALKEAYDIEAIELNAEKQITKVKVVSKVDQTKKKIYFDNEGEETTWEKPVENMKQEAEETL
ncbi:MAG: hypothetical protein Q4G63_08270 [Bacteroidia bacterium]|nr:hypothetical protein [Bacteroidia bacterium]